MLAHRGRLRYRRSAHRGGVNGRDCARRDDPRPSPRVEAAGPVAWHGDHVPGDVRVRSPRSADFESAVGDRPRRSSSRRARSRRGPGRVEEIQCEAVPPLRCVGVGGCCLPVERRRPPRGAAQGASSRGARSAVRGESPDLERGARPDRGQRSGAAAPASRIAAGRSSPATAGRRPSGPLGYRRRRRGRLDPEPRFNDSRRLVRPAAAVRRTS